MTLLNPTIFREYDVRGVVDIDLSDDFAYVLGRAYGSLALDAGKKVIGIGRDCRLSSPNYAQALANGIADTSIDVVMTGMGPTPQLYYSIVALELGGGIQVTGSHNPSDMNGFKLCLGTHTLSGTEIQDLLSRAKDVVADPQKGLSGKKGTISDRPMREDYIKMLIEKSASHMGRRKLKVVVDGGNGVGGLVGPAVLRGLGVEVIELFTEPDGTFPNHHPDPTVIENLTSLIASVKEHKADCGIGWDGDADRIGIVDENGSVIFGDMILLIYAREILKEVSSPTIIGDVKCSSRLFDDLTAKGANAIMWKTGHSLIKNKLYETKGELGGEMSGHIFFSHRFYGFDDAIYATSRFLEILSNTETKASQLLADVPKVVATPEIRLDCPEEIKFKIAERAQTAFKEFEVNTTDGARITFAHGWALVRASNTQPILVLRFEADTDARLNEYKVLVTDRIEMIKKQLSAAAVA